MTVADLLEMLRDKDPRADVVVCVDPLRRVGIVYGRDAASCFVARSQIVGDELATRSHLYSDADKVGLLRLVPPATPLVDANDPEVVVISAGG